MKDCPIGAVLAVTCMRQIILLQYIFNGDEIAFFMILFFCFTLYFASIFFYHFVIILCFYFF